MEHQTFRKHLSKARIERRWEPRQIKVLAAQPPDSGLSELQSHRRRESAASAERDWAVGAWPIVEAHRALEKFLAPLGEARGLVGVFGRLLRLPGASRSDALVRTFFRMRLGRCIEGRSGRGRRRGTVLRKSGGAEPAKRDDKRESDEKSGHDSAPSVLKASMNTTELGVFMSARQTLAQERVIGGGPLHFTGAARSANSLISAVPATAKPSSGRARQ
jgi:hypothetical protein